MQLYLSPMQHTLAGRKVRKREGNKDQFIETCRALPKTPGATSKLTGAMVMNAWAPVTRTTCSNFCGCT